MGLIKNHRCIRPHIAGLQRIVYKALPCDLQKFESSLNRRAHRWDSSRPVELADQLRCFLKLSVKSIPGTVRFSFILAFLNAWHTPGRFQETAGCPLCDAADGSSIEHWLRCPCWHATVLPLLDLSPFDHSRTVLAHILGLSDHACQIRWALFVDSIYHALIAWRHRSAEAARSAPIARLKFLRYRFPGHSLYAGRWGG